MSKIGFIGLGHMGHPMVLNLIKQQHAVKVFDLDTAAVQSLIGEGATQAQSAKDVAEGSEIVFTMLQTGEQVSSICLGDDGLFANLAPGALYIDSSSIDIATTRHLHQLAKEKNLAMLDAPVSGGVKGAEQASLTIMVGGDEAHFNRAKPILSQLGKLVVHAGSAGCGGAAKICNNLILGISMIAVSEGFTLAEKLGLDTKKFFDITSHASGQCWSMTNNCPAPNVVEGAPANNHYKPGFAASMMLKDLNLSQSAAQQVDLTTPLGAKAQQLYQEFVDTGHANLDFSAIIKKKE